MRIALVHYHLKRGGVTSVIRHQVNAIKSLGWEPLVITGAAPEAPLPCEVRKVSGLVYDCDMPPGTTPDSISIGIIDALHQHWPNGPHLLHVHNPTLAKNRHLQDVLNMLQRRGLPILCQIHDFAEDGRPGAYYRGPYLHDCHYAAINRRDHQLMLDAGLHRQGCHLLPNSITTPPSCDKEVPRHQGVLYPVRAIRRKNIGEAILLSLYFRRSGPLAVTLPPNSRDDIQCHQRWKCFVDQYDLPVKFDVGLSDDFSSLMAQCRFVLSTSITEGFGFAFLEAWSAGKPLWGRILPDICSGFVENGLNLAWMYHHLWVPMEWLQDSDVETRWKMAMSRAMHQYRLPGPPNHLEDAWRAITGNGRIDFGLLDETLQEKVMLRLINHSSDFERLKRMNPYLDAPGPPMDNEPVVSANQQVIDRYYRPAAYAQRLETVYRRVAAKTVRHHLNKTVLARAFLKPEQFSLLKWGAAHD